MVDQAQYTVGGIPVTVFGTLLPANPSPHGLAVLFALHGRFGRADEDRTVRLAKAFFAPAHRGENAKDLLVVTVDHRNHGVRLVDAERNKGWKDSVGIPSLVDDNEGALDNPSHMIDMYSIHTGTARDVSFLIDFLPTVLFPTSQRTITDYYVAGVSLGGHSTWLALGHDDRLSLGIPIIGAPDYSRLINHRKSSLPESLQSALPNPLFTPSLTAIIQRNDPVNLPRSTWKSKKILVLCGKNDGLVPWEDGGTRDFVSKLQSDGVTVEEVVQEGVGHAVSPEMVALAVKFVWENGLTSGPASKAAL